MRLLKPIFSILAMALALLPQAHGASEYSGMMARGGSSGALVKIGDAPGRIYVLSAGHATQFNKFQLIGTAMKNKLPTIAVSNFILDPVNLVPVLNDLGQPVNVTIDQVSYATLSGVDMGFFRTTLSSDEAAKLQLKVYKVATAAPQIGEAVTIVSGKWQEKQECQIDYVFSTLKEALFTWHNGYALSTACKVVGGWSGSPVISQATDEIVGVATTVNDPGTACAFDSPCEVADDGSISVSLGRTYAQQTLDIQFCFSSSGDLDLDRPGCHLERPNFSPQN